MPTRSGLRAHPWRVAQARYRDQSCDGCQVHAAPATHAIADLAQLPQQRLRATVVYNSACARRFIATSRLLFCCSVFRSDEIFSRHRPSYRNRPIGAPKPDIVLIQSAQDWTRRKASDRFAPTIRGNSLNEDYVSVPVFRAGDPIRIAVDKLRGNRVDASHG